MPQEKPSANRKGESEIVEGGDCQQGYRGANQRSTQFELPRHRISWNDANPEQVVALETVDLQPYTSQRRCLPTRLKFDLAANPPMVAERSPAHLLGFNRPVGGRKDHLQTVETGRMDENGRRFGQLLHR
jgi:hypothetical protein